MPATRGKYYLCRMGGNTRISHRVDSPREAAEYCFGIWQGIEYKLIGTRAYNYLTAKQKQELQGKEGWSRL